MTHLTELNAHLNIEGRILDIDRFTSHDGPGIRTTVFLTGCPLKCIWCHSPDSQSAKPQLLYQSARCQACYQCVSVCPVRAITAVTDDEEIKVDREKCTACGTCCRSCPSKALTPGCSEKTVGDVLSIVAKDKAYYKNSGGGVTLSGGEIMMQPDFSYNFLKACKDLAIHTAVETSGFGSEKAIHRIASVTDLILFDFKVLDEEQHRAFTGVSNSMILRNLESLCAIPAVRQKIVIRIPCIPSLNDSAFQVMKTARYVSKLGLKQIELLRYNEVAGAKYEWLDATYELEGMKTQSQKTMDQLESICLEAGLEPVRYQ